MEYFRSLQKIGGIYAGGISEDDILMFGYIAPNIVEDELITAPKQPPYNPSAKRTMLQFSYFVSAPTMW